MNDLKGYFSNREKTIFISLYIEKLQICANFFVSSKFLYIKLSNGTVPNVAFFNLPENQ